MRLWHKNLIEYLPDNQLRGQWRECILIVNEIKRNGTPNHLLVNKLTEYSKNELYTYCILIHAEMKKRNFNTTEKSVKSIYELLGNVVDVGEIFKGWHNKQYLRVCMANLYEKHIFGVGKSRITDTEWIRLCDGYKMVAGEEYAI